jgi:DNA-binding GntR family transcriptional regulator
MSSAEPAAFRRPPTAHEAVLARLRHLIATGSLRPGEQVRQEQLAEQLGVSRVPLREALRILEGEGRVTYHPHRGYFVTELSVEDLVEVYRIRELLEGEAIRVAVERATPEQRAEVDRQRLACESAAAAADLAAMTEANRAFHFALYDASGMPTLVRTIRLCWEATEVYRSLYYDDPRHRTLVVREHRGIAKAFLRGDADRAIALLAAHREHAVEALSRTLRP